MDDLCRTIAMFPGTYPVQLSWDSGPIRLFGLGDDPGGVGPDWPPRPGFRAEELVR